MNNFFKTLCYSEALDEWCKILDWLFDDGKFDKWNSNAVRAYTNNIKINPAFDKKNYIKGRELKYPNKSGKDFCIYMQDGDSESRELTY